MRELHSNGVAAIIMLFQAVSLPMPTTPSDLMNQVPYLGQKESLFKGEASDYWYE